MRKITTGGTLTGSRRKKGSTIKSGYRGNTRIKAARRKKRKIKHLRKKLLQEKPEILFRGEGGSEFTGSKKLKKKQRQAQKAGRKVQKARAKLPKTREYTLQRVFDEKTGKGKYVIVPLDKEKPFKQEGVSKTTMRRMQNEGRNFVHGKIAETEKENSAVEGAHKSEQKVESVYSFVKRQINGKEQKQRAKIAKLEKKQFKKEVNFQYQKFLEENPQMQKKALQKRLQKQRIKREYVKARKKAAAGKTAEQAFQKTKNGAVTVARKLQEFARKNAGLLVTVGIMALLLMMIMVSVSSCGAMFADTQSMILAASYLSKPKEIDAADLQLTRLELDLQNEIDRVETDYPGYDEYSYNLGAIGHTQSLYEKKLATYPRTDSQFLSDDMGQTAEGVIEAVFSCLMFEENKASSPDIKRILNSKKVTDHHAIIPTMEIAKADLAALPETERKILSLVANRLLCATGEKHLYETVKAEFSCNGHTFAVSGKSVTHNGWKSFEDAFKRSFKISGNPEEKEEKKLPELSEGQAFDGVQTKISEHFTSPPKHFTDVLCCQCGAWKAPRKKGAG